MTEGPALENITFSLNLVADVFLRLLSMLVVPLVFASIVVGVMSLGEAKHVGRLGKKTALYYFFTTTLAVITGLILSNLMQPGVGANIVLEGGKLPHDVSSPDSLWSVLTRIVPKNPFNAIANFDMVSVIFFAILFGLFANYLEAKHKKSILDFFEAVNEIMMRMAAWVISLAPIGIFCLVSKLLLTTGLEVFISLGKYVLTVAIALFIHFCITLPLIIWFRVKKNPYRYFRAMSPALLTAFSTASSAATLSLTMDCTQKGVGVSQRVSSFVLPMGATVNMDGTALYECVAVMFIAQVYGLPLPFATQMTIVLTAILASVGAAAIPHAGLVMMVIILQAVGLPLEATGMIWAVDRVLDMARTATNVWSDAVGAGVIAASEGEDLLSDSI